MVAPLSNGNIICGGDIDSWNNVWHRKVPQASSLLFTGKMPVLRLTGKLFLLTESRHGEKATDLVGVCPIQTSLRTGLFYSSYLLLFGRWIIFRI